jgi:hypothetical protein
MIAAPKMKEHSIQAAIMVKQNSSPFRRTFFYA